MFIYNCVTGSPRQFVPFIIDVSAALCSIQEGSYDIYHYGSHNI